MNNSLADKQANENDSVEYREAKKIYSDHKETCNRNISNYDWYGYFISCAANIGRSGFNEFATLLKAVDGLINATNRIAMNRATRLRILEQDGLLNDSEQGRIEAQAIAQRSKAAAEQEIAAHISTLKVVINRGIFKEISRNGYSREGMITLITELSADLIEMDPRLTPERARAYIEECMRNHPQIPRIAAVGTNPSGFFTQSSRTRNADAARPSAEAENSNEWRTN